MRLHRNPVMVLVAGALALGLLAGCGASPVSGTLSTKATVTSRLDALDTQVRARTYRTLRGTVTVLLPDDLQGLKHQLFRFRTPDGHTVQCAHNIDLAPYVPLRVGDAIEIKGEFIKQRPYDIIHWTHHDPKGGEGGYIKVNGKIYQ